MKRYAVIVSDGARAEAAEAIDYIIRSTSPEAAMKWLDELEELLASLGTMPERFALAPEDEYFASGRLRRALHFKHRVLFAVDDDCVRVLHIRHGMRDELKEP
jgi:plasmid stabilization system protein ParE